MTKDSVKPATDQSAFGLDRNTAAETAPQHKDRRESKNPAGRVKKKAEPANAFAAKGEKN